MNKQSGDKLLDLLDELRIKLNSIEDLKELTNLLEQLRNRLNISGVERTVGLRDNMGNDCTFYSKSLDLFLRKDYIDLKGLVEALHTLFREIG